MGCMQADVPKAPFPRLFVTDLDDTALGGGYQPYARFPDPFAAFLDRLAGRDCLWAINTSWGVDGQWQVVLASAVRSRPAFLIAEFGLRLARVTEQGPEFVQPYTREMEARIAEVNEAHQFPLMREVCARFRPVRMHFYGHVFEFYPRPEDREALAELARRHAENPALLVGLDRAFSTFPRLLAKGLGLKEVLRITGITPDRVVVAGDSLQDWSMMVPELAGYIVCGSNADPKVQAEARRRGAVGTDVCSRGVIQAFEDLARRNGWVW